MAGSVKSALIVVSVPGVVFREIGLLSWRQGSAIGVIEDADWRGGCRRWRLVRLVWRCRFAAEDWLLIHWWWLRLLKGLLWLIMCGPWVSDRAVSGLWSRIWIGGLGWRRCRRPPVWGCGDWLLLWKRWWRTLWLSKCSC